MTVSEARRFAHTVDRRILDLIRQEEIESAFFDEQHWVKRESLERWIAKRDSESDQYMSSSETKTVLGLGYYSVRKLADVGMIRYLQGYNHLFSCNRHFFRDDVVGIIQAFNKHNVPRRKYANAGKLVSLGDAISYLGRDVLPDLIQAVGQGDLIPVAYAKRSHGIAGYLFPSEILERYHRGNKPLPTFAMKTKAASNLLDESERMRRLMDRHELNRRMGPHRRSILEPGQTDADSEQKKKLSKREQQVLSHLCKGLTSREIGQQIGTSKGAVKAVLQQLFRKFGVRTRGLLISRVAAEVQPDRIMPTTVTTT